MAERVHELRWWTLAELDERPAVTASCSRRGDCPDLVADAARATDRPPHRSTSACDAPIGQIGTKIDGAP